MDSEPYKLILNVREVVERSKTQAFVNCRIKFNQVTQTSFVPFRQGIVFNFTSQDRKKTLELRFDKDCIMRCNDNINLKDREIGRLTLKLDNQLLSNRVEIEKWFDLDNTEPGHKISAKISLSIMRQSMETSRSRLSLKQNNFFEAKSIEGSPRLNLLTNRLTNYMKNSNMRSPHDDQYSQVSPHQSIIESNTAEYMSCPQPAISSRQLDLKLNLQSVVKAHKTLAGIRAEISPKDPIRSIKNRDHQRQDHQGIKVHAEPLTYRDRKAEDKQLASRKTKSLEKPLNLSRLEKDSKEARDEEPYQEDSKPNSSRRTNDGPKSGNQVVEYLTLRKDQKETRLSPKKLDYPQNKKGKEIMKEENSKLRRDNHKLDQMIWDMEKTRDNYESENRKHADKLDFYMEKCTSLEKELAFTQNQLGLWKSKAEIIKLLENELEGLRRILKERDRNVDIEKAIHKKRTDFEKALRDLQEENSRYRERTEKLEEALDELTKKNHVLRQEKEKVTSENILLKVRIASLEVNEEQLRHLNMQKEEIFEEIEMLRTTNKQLRDLIMGQKDTLWQNDENQQIKFNEAISKLKRKVENLGNTAISHLQNINDLEKLGGPYNSDGDSDGEGLEETTETNKKVSSVEAEPEKGKETAKTLSDNKKPEKSIHDNKTLKRENIASGKYKSADFQAGTNSAIRTPPASFLNKVKIEKFDSQIAKKQSYTPTKDDPVDLKLGEFINSHPEARKIVCLMKRKMLGNYTFGSIKFSPKLESDKLYIKVGKSYHPIENFLNLYLDSEYEKLLSDSNNILIRTVHPITLGAKVKRPKEK